jgi:hypothetical protein
MCLVNLAEGHLKRLDTLYSIHPGTFASKSSSFYTKLCIYPWFVAVKPLEVSNLSQLGPTSLKVHIFHVLDPFSSVQVALAS